MTANFRYFSSKILMPAFLLLFFSKQVLAIDVEDELQQISSLKDKQVVNQKYQQLLDNSALSLHEQVKVHLAFAQRSFGSDSLDLAFKQSSLALEKTQNSDMRHEQAKAHKFIGIYYYYKGNHEQAVKAYEQGINLINVHEQPLAKANLYNNIALAYAAMLKTQHALHNYYLADEIFQVHGSEEDKIDIRYNTSTLYVRLHRHDMAIELLQEVITKRLKMNDFRGAALAKGDIALSYRQSGQYEKAQEFMKQALEFFDENNDLYHTAAQLCNLAGLNVHLSHYERAMQYGNRGAQIAQNNGFDNTFADCSYDLSMANFAMGNIEMAAKHAKVASKIAKQNNYQFLVETITGLNGLIQANQHQYTEALENYLDFKVRYAQQSSTALNEQLTQFESDILNQKIATLEKQNQLENEAKTRNYVYLAIATLVVLVVSFLMYKRNQERLLVKRLTIEIKQGKHELALAKEKLLNLRFVDNLTEIPNRKAFDNDIPLFWQRSKTSVKDSAILVVDIDKFHDFNVEYGYLAGDEALKRIAKTLQNTIRSEDSLYRYGGQAFAVTLEGQDVLAAKATYARIEHAIEKLQIPHSDKHGYLSLSAGAAVITECDSFTCLVDKAVRRLSGAKKIGRTCIAENE